MKREMKEAEAFLYDLPKYTKKNSLENTKALMEILGNPCRDRKVIHVAGSNGKGSVCSFLYHMLLAGGFSAAMFTSPHLTDIRERFQIDGQCVGEDAFLSAFHRVKKAEKELTGRGKEHPTFFEFVYAIAMVLFEQSDVTYVILETGLGGRLDATNSFPSPILCVITPICLEHTEILGETVDLIAAEKAGILKKGVPVVYAADDVRAAKVIGSRAAELGCPAVPVCASSREIYKISGNAIDFSLLCDYDKKTMWQVPGHALYQVENAHLAIEAMRLLDIMSEEALRQGIRDTVWPGRMQEVLPGIYFDGAHNPAGIEAFLSSARELSKADPDPPILLFSMLMEKDLKTTAGLLVNGMDWDVVSVTTIPGQRGVPAERIADLFALETEETVELFPDCRDAFFSMCARKREGQKMFCTGSLYFIGALMETLGDEIGGDHGL